MKRILGIVIVVMLALTITSCGSKTKIETSLSALQSEGIIEYGITSEISSIEDENTEDIYFAYVQVNYADIPTIGDESTMITFSSFELKIDSKSYSCEYFAMSDDTLDAASILAATARDEDEEDPIAYVSDTNGIYYGFVMSVNGEAVVFVPDLEIENQVFYLLFPVKDDTELTGDAVLIYTSEEAAEEE